MTDKEKLLKLRKLADAMYYAAQQLTTDASRLHKAMEDYHQFIINEYHKEEPVSKDLEKAAKEYSLNFEDNVPILQYDVNGYPNISFEDIENAFKVGAKWQKQQDQETIELAEDHAMFAGMNKMEQQLMAKAIDGIARPYDNEIWCILDSFNLKDGDKVKVILIKED